MSIKEIFNSFNKLHILVIGDVMVDAYLWGAVERISPEAPVPVVTIRKREERLGGASNVAINIKAMGATPFICSVIGNDQEGTLFKRLLKHQKMSDEGIVQSPDRITTVKTRVIGNHHQMLRVDSETEKNLSREEKKIFIRKIITLLSNHRIDAIVFEDYDKGLLDKEIIELIIAEALKRGIPTAVDPKKNNFLSYRNVTLFKPNLKELKEGMKIDLDASDMQGLKKSVEQFRKKQGIDTMLLTLSEHGVYVCNGKLKKHIPAHIRDISDVSGAGDTVIAVAALCLALGLPADETARLSNLAGGQVCEHVGVVPVNKAQLFHEATHKK